MKAVSRTLFVKKNDHLKQHCYAQPMLWRVSCDNMFDQMIVITIICLIGYAHPEIFMLLFDVCKSILQPSLFHTILSNYNTRGYYNTNNTKRICNIDNFIHYDGILCNKNINTIYDNWNKFNIGTNYNCNLLLTDYNLFYLLNDVVYVL